MGGGGVRVGRKERSNRGPMGPWLPPISASSESNGEALESSHGQPQARQHSVCCRGNLGRPFTAMGASVGPFLPGVGSMLPTAHLPAEAVVLRNGPFGIPDVYYRNSPDQPLLALDPKRRHHVKSPWDPGSVIMMSPHFEGAGSISGMPQVQGFGGLLGWKPNTRTRIGTNYPPNP